MAPSLHDKVCFIPQDSDMAMRSILATWIPTVRDLNIIWYTRRSHNPVLFLIGNSTMRNGTLGNGNNGQWGWGYFEHEFFDENKITVENQALGGMRDSRLLAANLLTI